MKQKVLYNIIILVVFAGAVAIFNLLPRTKYSELEKREMATFPEYSYEKLKNNILTKEISSWYSDSEPFRDELMSASMMVRDKMRAHIDEENAITVHSSESGNTESLSTPGMDATANDIEEYENHVTADENAKISSAGSIIVIGKAPNARALMAYGGSENGGGEYIKAVNEYKEELPGLHIYSMVVPIATEFYIPDKVKKASQPELPTIKHIYTSLKGVTPVDAYSALAHHVEEDIYLRTDHHWSPLGAYYAAEAFAKAAGVPFKNLSSYERREVKNVVGSMYGYSKDIAIKNSPETFVYYAPKNVNYTTTFVNYTLNKDYKITGIGKPYTGPFFYKIKDGSGAAYNTFMGSDMKLTKVVTSTGGTRRLLIIKDSYGNAIPGYLFYSFGEIHVVDFRYFTHNLKKYVRDNNITDLLFVTNIYNAYSGSIYKKLHKFLVQGEGVEAIDTAPAKSTKETTVHKEEPTKKESTKEIETPKQEIEEPTTPLLQEGE
jgi:hypothetical protein